MALAGSGDKGMREPGMGLPPAKIDAMSARIDNTASEKPNETNGKTAEAKQPDAAALVAMLSNIIGSAIVSASSAIAVAAAQGGHKYAGAEQGNKAAPNTALAMDTQTTGKGGRT